MDGTPVAPRGREMRGDLTSEFSAASIEGNADSTNVSFSDISPSLRDRTLLRRGGSPNYSPMQEL